jgi:hypothetical protein
MSEKKVKVQSEKIKNLLIEFVKLYDHMEW